MQVKTRQIKKSFVKNPIITLLLSCFFFCCSTYAQDKLYRNTFSLTDVTLVDSPFKHARDRNIQTLPHGFSLRLTCLHWRGIGLTLFRRCNPTGLGTISPPCVFCLCNPTIKQIDPRLPFGLSLSVSLAHLLLRRLSIVQIS